MSSPADPERPPVDIEAIAQTVANVLAENGLTGKDGKVPRVTEKKPAGPAWPCHPDKIADEARIALVALLQNPATLQMPSKTIAVAAWNTAYSFFDVYKEIAAEYEATVGDPGAPKQTAPEPKPEEEEPCAPSES